MIPRSHFTQIADRDEVDAKTVERDYVLTHIVAALGAEDAEHGLVFKGGTALRLCHFEDYRYSADLDFSLQDGASAQEAIGVVSEVLRRLAESLGFARLQLSEDAKLIEYVGPLGKQRALKLDIATDELIEETATVQMLARYRDQPEAEVLVYTLQEVAAEKLRCVIQRLQARDLFDLHELLVVSALDVEQIWPTFERKARHKRIDSARFSEMFEKRMPRWKDRWETEMIEHVPGEPPPFNAVERGVRRALRSRLRGD